MTNKRMDFKMSDLKIVDFPLVMASFLSYMGNRVGGYFLIDTASQHNIMNGSILGIIPDPCRNYDGIMTLTSFAGESIPAKEVHLPFEMDGYKFDERFYVTGNLNLDAMFGRKVILGILGVEFLAKYGLAVDFDAGSVHTSDIKDHGINLDDFDFLFPQGYGFKYYGLPVVGIVKDDREYICLVDSGSNLNATTKEVLPRASEKVDFTGEEASIISIAGIRRAKMAHVKIDILGIGRKYGTTILHPYELEMQVVDGMDYIVNSTKNIPPVSAIIGTEFLLSQKWVIDFAARLIYGRDK